MKLKDFLYIIIVVLLLVIMWAFYDKEQRAKKANLIIKRLRKENHEIKTSYLNLLEKYIRQQKNVDIGLIQEVQKLKRNTDALDFEVHIELEEIINNLTVGKAEEAIRKLAKIVERKLSEKVKEDEGFKGQPMLNNLLNHAAKCNWINKRQFENALLFKEIRNEESHQIATVGESRELALSILTGIDIIYSI
jgi:hypothetical protein